MLIDPHVHSLGISLCSRMTTEELIDMKIKQGYGGAMLTNHCQPHYPSVKDPKKWAEDFIAEYERGKEYADKFGFRFFLGIEVTLLEPAYADYLLYGVTPDFLRKTACLVGKSQRELYGICKDNGVFLVQAHPTRDGQTPKDPRFLDGIEINCTERDYAKKDEVIQYALKHKLTLTCGSDTHYPEAAKRLGGMIVPDDLKDAVEFAKYLRTCDETILYLTEGIKEFKNGGKA